MQIEECDKISRMLGWVAALLSAANAFVTRWVTSQALYVPPVLRLDARQRKRPLFFRKTQQQLLGFLSDRPYAVLYILSTDFR